MISSNVLRDLIRVLGKNMGGLEKYQFTCCGITIGQCYAILEIGLAKEISLIELATFLNLDKSTMSRTVNSLVNRRLVERLIDPDNRRYVKIRLTEEGKDAFASINTIFDSYLKGVFESIPENKRTQVMESLEILIEALKDKKCC